MLFRYYSGDYAVFHRKIMCILGYLYGIFNAISRRFRLVSYDYKGIFLHKFDTPNDTPLSTFRFIGDTPSDTPNDTPLYFCQLFLPSVKRGKSSITGIFIRTI